MYVAGDNGVGTAGFLFRCLSNGTLSFQLNFYISGASSIFMDDLVVTSGGQIYVYGTDATSLVVAKYTTIGSYQGGIRVTNIYPPVYSNAELVFHDDLLLMSAYQPSGSQNLVVSFPTETTLPFTLGDYIFNSTTFITSGSSHTFATSTLSFSTTSLSVGTPAFSATDGSATNTLDKNGLQALPSTLSDVTIG